MSYFTWYYPGSDAHHIGVTAVFSDDALPTFGNISDAMRAGAAEDVFDVSIYDEGGEAESRQAMANVLELANLGLRVIEKVPELLDAAKAYVEEYDRPCTEVDGGWLDPEGLSLKDGESAEEYYAAVATIETLGQVADLLVVGEVS
jgi:hypothetical protein